jgi:hypothetical protein
LDLAEQRSIVRIFPFFASRHALAAGGEHLTCVLFPNVESLDFFFQRQIAIVNQFVGRGLMGLRMLNLVGFGRTPLRISTLLVAARPVGFVFDRPRGTLGVLVPTSQLLSPKLRSWLLRLNQTRAGMMFFCEKPLSVTERRFPPPLLILLPSLLPGEHRGKLSAPMISRAQLRVAFRAIIQRVSWGNRKRGTNDVHLQATSFPGVY